MSQHTECWCILLRWAAKAQTSLCICTDSVHMHRLIWTFASRINEVLMHRYTYTMVRLVTLNMFKPLNTLTDCFLAGASFLIVFVIYVHDCLIVLYCIVLPCDHLLGKGWPLCSPVCGVSLCFVASPCGVSGQVLYLHVIVSILDLCLLLNFENSRRQKAWKITQHADKR